MARTITFRSNDLEISEKIKRIMKKKFEAMGFATSDQVESDSELVISVGGDGSFLKAARDLDFPDLPFICVNTGHLGFFAEILPDEAEIDYFIECYQKKNYSVNDISLLEIEIQTNEETIIKQAINELVVRGNRSRTAHLILHVDGNYMETFSGDGLIISTSTGSTAYNYSAGGSIVDNRLKIMQITPISPISTNAFRSFTSSIILPSDDSEVSIIPEYKNDATILIVIDGEETQMKNVSLIKTRESQKNIKLLRLSDYEFWDRVYMKFLKTYDYKADELRRRNL